MTPRDLFHVISHEILAVVQRKKTKSSVVTGFCGRPKIFVAGPKLSTITTKLQQSMDDLAVYANLGLNAGKTKTLVPAFDPIYP